MPLGSCGGSAGSTGCTAWVIEMGNMDYLKLNDNKSQMVKNSTGQRIHLVSN